MLRKQQEISTSTSQILGEMNMPNSKNDGLPDIYQSERPFETTQTRYNAFFNIPSLNQDCLLKQLHRTSNSRCTGLDGIGIRLLKLITDFIAPHITSIYDASISSGTFPDV